MITKNPTKILKNSFKSEIDWSKWNSEIPNNKNLLDEYFIIEKTTKENGTWMRTPRNYKIFSEVDEINLNSLKSKIQNNKISSFQLPLVERLVKNLEIAKENSTIYQGTPEQFVQAQSETFKKTFLNPSITHRGSFGHLTYKGSLAESNNSCIGSIFTADKESATHYGNNIIINDPLHASRGLLELVYSKSDNSFEVSANGSGWKDIDRSNIPKTHLEKINILFGNGQHINTNDLAKYIELSGVDYAKVRNVFDGIEIKEEIIFNHRPGNYLKSRWHNNGLFDMTNSSIYK
jgi:hypothetical protein